MAERNEPSWSDSVAESLDQVRRFVRINMNAPAALIKSLCLHLSTPTSALVLDFSTPSVFAQPTRNLLAVESSLLMRARKV